MATLSNVLQDIFDVQSDYELPIKLDDGLLKYEAFGYTAEISDDFEKIQKAKKWALSLPELKISENEFELISAHTDLCGVLVLVFENDLIFVDVSKFNGTVLLRGIPSEYL